MEQTMYHHVVDIHNKRIFPGEVVIQDHVIVRIQETNKPCEHYILPGFIDAHVHIESSMLIPSEFARLATIHGTVATVSDPHEIANVCGMEGIEYMIQNGKKVPFHFFFGAPSCVPATAFETAGAILASQQIDELLQREEILYLSEMMNYPGVLFKDEEVMRKIALAQKYNKPVDGHAPGLRGEDALKYIQAGISTDHECYTREEALEKLQAGMNILIREGSAAKNFEALIDLLPTWEKQMMFCCDDKHPDELLIHHINHHVQRAVQRGIDVFKVLQAACINPVEHYKLPVGLLREGDAADFIIVRDLNSFDIIETWIQGKLVAKNKQSRIPSIQEGTINQFKIMPKAVHDFILPKVPGKHSIHVIEAIEGQLITKTVLANIKEEDGNLVSDIDNDTLKMVVVNRYSEAPIAVAFIKNFGLKEGAIASTVAHDSHNIIAVGVTDKALCDAVNAIIACEGGVVALGNNKQCLLPLPVGGLMSNLPAEEVASQYSKVDAYAKELGSTLRAPFMTLSFMALLVIPQLKLSDKGLFDGATFNFVDLQIDSFSTS